MALTFERATTRAAKSCITMQDVAKVCGVSKNTVDRARLARSNPNVRTAPPGWETKLARLCRDRAAALVKLADTLDPEG